MIELLVVIAIVTILASLLMPALNNAKASAWQIGCTNNQRQMIAGVLMYADDWGDALPYGYHGNAIWKKPRRWWKIIAPYVLHQREDDYVNSVMQCPSPGRIHPLAHNTTYDVTLPSYQYHGRVLKRWGIVGWYGLDAYDQFRLQAFTEPETTWVFVDAYTIDPVGNAESQQGSMGNDPARITRVNRSCHPPGLVFSFLDGHARWYSQSTKSF